MSARSRLLTYGVVVIAVFAVSFGVGRTVVPDGAAQRWNERVEAHPHSGGSDDVVSTTIAHAPDSSNHDAHNESGHGR